MTDTLRLRGDAYYAPSPTGTYILTHRGPISLRGNTIHTWLDRLAPHLDGSHSLDQLTAGMSQERRTFVETLVNGLRSKGVITATHPSQCSDDGTPESRFLAYFEGASAASFRTGRLAIVGAGPLSVAIEKACRRAGATSVVTVDDALSLRAEHPDFVIYLAEAEGGNGIRAVEVECARTGAILSHIVAEGGNVWITPPGKGGLDAHTWSAVWNRLHAWETHPHPDVSSMSPAEVTLVANQAVHRLFTYVSGVEPGHPESVIRFDTSTATTHRHRYVNAGRTAAQLAREPLHQRVNGLALRPPMTEEEFSRAAFRLSDDHTGIFGEITEGNFAQSPLHVATTRVADPSGMGQNLRVFGTGRDFAQARYATARIAISHYCSRTVDTTRLRDGGVETWCPTSGTTQTVPAERVFPNLAPPDQRELVGTGVTAALDWKGAVLQGLLKHARRLTLTHPRAMPSTVTPCEPKPGAASSTVRYCLTMLQAAGVDVTVYDVTGPLGVPVLTCALDGHVVSNGTGLDTGQALSEALVSALLHLQSEINGQPEYRPAPVSPLPCPSAPGAGLALPTRRITLPQMLDRLASHGFDVALVPLDHDAGVAEIFPFVVNVVVSDRDR